MIRRSLDAGVMHVRATRLSAMHIIGVACLTACSVDAPQRQAIIERDQLRREVAGFRSLDSLAREGAVDRKKDVIITVSDSLLRDMFVAALPVTATLPGDLKVQLTKADVTFRANAARVHVTGDLQRTAFPKVAALITLNGALDAFAVDSTRTLRARMTLDDVAVEAPSGVPGALGPIALSMLQSVVERGLPELTAKLPAMALPVRLDRDLRLPGFGPEGVIAIPAVSAPLTVAAHNVVAFRNRLWLSISVQHGAFAPVAGKAP